MGNKIVVGVWDCAYCGADKISGEIQVCPHCGKPRGSDVKFYMAGPKQYVKDPDKVSRNPDWLCSYCDTLNPDENKYCSSCGASRADSELNYFQNKEKKEREEAEEKRRQEMQNNGAREGDGPAGRSKGPGRLPLIAGILLVIGILAFMMMPKNKKMQVDGKTWERTVDIEQYTQVDESGWTLPDGAYDVSSREEISGYTQVLDHYETREREVAEEVFDGYDTEVSYKDLGNGHFEEIEEQVPRYRTEYHTETYEEPVYISVPVYDTKYYYHIKKWVYERTETTSGTDDEPYFAAPDLTGDEREGKKTESYSVTSGGKTYKVSFDLWQQIETGSGVRAVIQGGEIVQLK